MAKICELVSVKFNLMFGDGDTLEQHKFINEKVYPILGLEKKNGITIEEVIQLRDYLVKLSPKCRIIGFEENDGCEIISTEVWESYGDSYDPYWIEKVSSKLNTEARFSIFVKLPKNIWGT